MKDSSELSTRLDNFELDIKEIESQDIETISDSYLSSYSDHLIVICSQAEKLRSQLYEKGEVKTAEVELRPYRHLQAELRKMNSRGKIGKKV